MADVVNLKAYRKRKELKKRTLWPWDQPRTAQKVSREALLFVSSAAAGFLSSDAHFVVLPVLCTLLCFILWADLMYLALRPDEKATHGRPKDNSPPPGAA